MPKAYDILSRKIARQSRTPLQGSLSNAMVGGSISTPSAPDEFKITDEGAVKRLWTPGDPWTEDYYFGGSR